MQVRLVVVVPSLGRGEKRLNPHGARVVALREREGELGAQRGLGVVVEGVELLAWCWKEVSFVLDWSSGWNGMGREIVGNVPFSRCTRKTRSSTVILCPHIRSSGGHCRRSIDLVTNLATSCAAVRHRVTVGLPSASSAGTCALMVRQFMM